MDLSEGRRGDYRISTNQQIRYLEPLLPLISSSPLEQLITIHTITRASSLHVPYQTLIPVLYMIYSHWNRAEPTT